MKETEVIQKTSNNPATVQSLANDLSALGITSGMTVLAKPPKAPRRPVGRRWDG
jgi:hypothetical protein